MRRNPELAGLPVIVGGNGDPSEPRKVVTCASYPAREFGVHAGMPLRTAARKCPDATFLPLDTDAYDEASEEVMGLLRDFGHPVEVWGWDEAYRRRRPQSSIDPFHLAEQIREVVAAGTGLSCSVGISDNKQRAKVATGFGKPAGIYALTEDNWMAVMGDREVDALWGVGPKTAKKLAGMGITTVADLASTDVQLLTSTFGPTTGLWILLLAKGGGDTDVSAEPWVARSRSHVITFPRDLTDRAEIDSAVVELAHQTLEEIVGQARVVTRVAVTVRTKTFFTRTKIRKLDVGEHRCATSSRTPRWTCSASSNSTGRSGSSGCDWSSHHRTAATSPTAHRWPNLNLCARFRQHFRALAQFRPAPSDHGGGRSARVKRTLTCRIATL